MGKTEMLPLRMGTRQRFQKIGTIPFAAGQPGATMELPRVGLLNRLVVQFRGTVTKSGAGALADSSPFNIISRLRLNANVGAAQIVDVSGYGLYAAQPTLRGGYSPSAPTVNAAAVGADTFAAPTAAGTSPLTFTMIVPVAINNGAQFDSGMIQLQAPELRTTLEVVWGALGDYAADCTGITGALHVGYYFYEVPDLSTYALPKLALCRTLEESQPILNTGDTAYTIPRMGTLLNLTHIVRLNGARSDAIDGFAVRFNKSDTPYAIERQFFRGIMGYHNRAAQDVGVYTHDLFSSFEQVNTGDLRDAIDSEENSVTESIVSINSAAVLGSANNELRSVRRVFQVLEG